MSIVTFWGNYGEIDVDAISGAVVAYRQYEGEPAGYSDIVRVDLAERREWYAQRGIHLPAVQPDGDILDVGFWTDKCEYVAAEMEWRERRLNVAA